MRITDIEIVNSLPSLYPMTDFEEEAIDEVVKGCRQQKELLDTLTDRPCEVCKHWDNGGCSQWECVFKGKIGGAE